MRKTIKEFVEKTGLSRSTVRKIFLVAGVTPENALGPATMEVVEFNRVLKELGAKKRMSIKRTKKSTVASIFFDYITIVAKDKYESMNKFFEETGFERKRWYSLSESFVHTLTEKEETILRGLLNEDRGRSQDFD